MLRTCDFIFYMTGTMVLDMVICKLQVLKPQQDSPESHRSLKKGELWPITARNKNPNYYLVKKIIIYAELDNYEGGKKKAISIWIPDTCWVLEGNVLHSRFGARPLTWTWFSSMHINQPGFIITPLTWGTLLLFRGDFASCSCSCVKKILLHFATSGSQLCRSPWVVHGRVFSGVIHLSLLLGSQEQEILFPAALKNQGIQK